MLVGSTAGSSAIRQGEMKLILGAPGDARLLRWPELESERVSFAGTRREGTQCLAGIVADGVKDNSWKCEEGCLFNLTSDPGE